MIDFDDKAYVIGFWMVGGAEMDWMCCLWIPQGSDKILGKYRFRYYDPLEPLNDAFSGRDKKSWYQLEAPPEDKDKLVGAVNMLAEMVALKNGTEVDFTLVENNGKVAADVLMKKPWAHAKPVTQAAAEVAQVDGKGISH